MTRIKKTAMVLLAVGFGALLGIRAEDKPTNYTYSVAGYVAVTNQIPTVEWLGSPAFWVEDGDKITIDGKTHNVNVRPRQAYTASVEIGLRSDGVVVWREKK